MEIVTGQDDLFALEQPLSQGHFPLGVEQREFGAADFGRIDVHDALEAVTGEIAAQLGHEHLTQPVHEERAGGLADDSGVDFDVLIRRVLPARQRRHWQDDRRAAGFLNDVNLMADTVDQLRRAGYF